jgi:hypothetical protein
MLTTKHGFSADPGTTAIIKDIIERPVGDKKDQSRLCVFGEYLQVVVS